jgi:hypothetical protein
MAKPLVVHASQARLLERLRRWNAYIAQQACPLKRQQNGEISQVPHATHAKLVDIKAKLGDHLVKNAWQGTSEVTIPQQPAAKPVPLGNSAPTQDFFTAR